MKKNLARTMLLFIAVAVIGYFAFMSYVSSQMRAASIETWDAMKDSIFECPAGTEVRTEGWSKLGVSRTCSSPRHGRWEAWSDGYKRIDGIYQHGKKHGVWVFYNPDGSVSKRIEYKQEAEMPEAATVKDESS
jgi:hypothetical protein